METTHWRPSQRYQTRTNNTIITLE